MSRKKRMKDIREAKDRRAKKLAIGGAVLLVAVLAFEVPKVLKHGGSSSTTPPAATTTAAAATPTASASTAPGTAAAAALPTTASTKLPDSDRAPKVSKSQLLSFSHFAGKDPFVQQVSAASGPSAGAASGAIPPSTPTGVIPATPTATATSVHVGGSAASPARTLAKTGAVTLSVNGTVQTIRVGASFPSSNPLFRLVSVAHGVVRIGIANGSYASGTQTVALSAGRTLTLVDTSDGARYKLRLVSGA
jgi:hypothetical protein